MISYPLLAIFRSNKTRNFGSFAMLDALMPFLSVVIYDVCLYCVVTNLKPMMFFGESAHLHYPVCSLIRAKLM